MDNYKDILQLTRYLIEEPSYTGEYDENKT